MKKRISSAVIILLTIVLLLTGCSGEPVPEGMDETAVLEKATEIAELFGNENAAKIYALLRDDVAATLTEDDVKAIMPDTKEWVGVINGVVIGARDAASGEEYAKAVLVCKYKGKRMTLNVALDKNMELIGLRLD